MNLPDMIPMNVVHEFDLTALLAWMDKQESAGKTAKQAAGAVAEEVVELAAGYVYEHDPKRVLKSMRELFPERDHAPTMREWLASEVKQILRTRGSLPTEPTPGVRIWLDDQGKIQFNPDMVCPAQQYVHGVRPKWWSGTDKAGTFGTNVGPGMNKALRAADRTGWTSDWWGQHQEHQTGVEEANAINKRTFDEALGRVA